MKTTFKILSCVLMSLWMTLNANAFTTTESETLKVWYELPTFIADGKTVNYIKVYEKDGDNEYSAFNMHFILPEGLQINKIKQGRELVNDITLSERASSTHAISCNMPDATTLKVICTSSMNDNLYNTDLDDQPLDYLFEVGLIADPSLAAGEYEISLDGIKFVFKNGDASVPANEPITATMTVESNTSDFTTTESETLKVWYELPTFIADGKTVNYIKVYENDGDNEYSAFNMHFFLPEGLQINKIKQGRELVNDITLSERASSTHAISCNMPDATTLKVICTSSMNDNLYNTNLEGQPVDYLFEVGLIADPSLAAGKYEISLDGIKFVFKNGNASVPANEPITATMTVESGTSGIDAIAADGINPEESYDIMGRKVNPANVHGIIVISNGTKVLVK